MRNRSFMLRIGVLTILTGTLLAKSLHAQVEFSDSSFEALVEKAGAEDKLVFIDAYTDWCGWCKVMDKNTFSTEEVAAYMNPQFYSMKLNMEEGFGIDMAMKYRVSFYPQYLIFDGEGQLIGRLGGYMEPQPFMEAMETALMEESRLPRMEDPMNFDMGFPEFYRKSFLKRPDRAFPEPETIDAFLKTRNDIKDPVTWGVVSRFLNSGPWMDSLIVHKEELAKIYGKDEITDKLASLVYADVKTAIKDSSEADLELALNKADRLLGESADSYKFRYRLYYYQMTKNWDAYSNLGNEVYQGFEDSDIPTLNQIAWTLFENSDNPENLGLAAQWMKAVVDREPSYAYLDTYAWLTYKLNRNNDALAIAEQAIEEAEKTGEDTESTQELIDLIKGEMLNGE